MVFDGGRRQVGRENTGIGILSSSSQHLIHIRIIPVLSRIVEKQEAGGKTRHVHHNPLAIGSDSVRLLLTKNPPAILKKLLFSR
jgi:hypothetical protein